MNRARLIVVATVASMFVLLFAQAALAGEYAPGHGYNGAPSHANSECVYNGHDDIDAEDDELWGAAPSKGVVQSGGQIIALYRTTGIYIGVDPGVQRFACNGHTAGLK